MTDLSQLAQMFIGQATAPAASSPPSWQGELMKQMDPEAAKTANIRNALAAAAAAIANSKGGLIRGISQGIVGGAQAYNAGQNADQQRRIEAMRQIDQYNTDQRYKNLSLLGQAIGIQGSQEDRAYSRQQDAQGRQDTLTERDYQHGRDARQDEIERQKLARGDGVKSSLVPVTGVDEEGNAVLLQPRDDGTVVKMALPAGVKISKAPIVKDAGTSYVMLDPVTRQSVGEIPKDIAGAEAQKEIGASQGKATASAPGDLAVADQALDLLGKIENSPALESGTGLSSVTNSIPGTEGYGFQQMVNQANSGAFLTAIERMRGMGALSEKEGDTARSAISRMSTASSKKDFLDALRDYRRVVEQGKARAMQRMQQGQQQGAAQTPPAASATQSKTPPAKAIEHLKAHPELRAKFDEWYGPGAADAVLGR